MGVVGGVPSTGLLSQTPLLLVLVHLCKAEKHSGELCAAIPIPMTTTLAPTITRVKVRMPIEGLECLRIVMAMGVYFYFILFLHLFEWMACTSHLTIPISLSDVYT